MQQGYNVFISYRGAGSGGLLGKEIYTDLKNAPNLKGQPQIIPFFAPACIPKGENFKYTIQSVINDVSCVVLILSKDFFKNCSEPDDMVRFELKEALKNPDITFIPVIMEGFSFEEELSTIADIFTEEEISRFKHINAINHHGIYDFKTEAEVLPTLRKILALDDIKNSPTPFAVKEPKNKNNTVLTIGITAIAVILALILVVLLFKNDNSQSDETAVSDSSVSSTVTENIPSVTTSSSTPNETSKTLLTQTSSLKTETSSLITQPSSSAKQQSNKGTNQIPEKYKNEVEALKHSDYLSLSTATLRVKVGGYITPSAASTWKNVNIYSENANIAVGEGLMVKGVSSGETYVIVESYLGSTSAYYVIVE